MRNASTNRGACGVAICLATLLSLALLAGAEENSVKPQDGEIEQGKPQGNKESPWVVMLYTVIMSLFTGLGSVPFYFTNKLSPFWEGVAQSVAIGVMLSASFALIQEGEEFSNLWLVLGVMAGIVFIQQCQVFLEKYEELKFSGLSGLDAKKTLLIVGIMTLHAIGEGCGVGVAYGSPKGFSRGILITIAIGVHNIPEGLALATILASRNIKPRQVTLWTIFSSLPQPMLAVPSYMFVQVFSELFPFFSGFAAGCMIWISFSELVPDTLENVSASTMGTVCSFSVIGFKAIQYATEALAVTDLPNPDWTNISLMLCIIGFVGIASQMFTYILDPMEMICTVALLHLTVAGNGMTIASQEEFTVMKVVNFLGASVLGFALFMVSRVAFKRGYFPHGSLVAQSKVDEEDPHSKFPVKSAAPVNDGIARAHFLTMASGLMYGLVCTFDFYRLQLVSMSNILNPRTILLITSIFGCLLSIISGSEVLPRSKLIRSCASIAMLMLPLAGLAMTSESPPEEMNVPSARYFMSSTSLFFLVITMIVEVLPICRSNFTKYSKGLTIGMCFALTYTISMFIANSAFYGRAVVKKNA